MSGGYTISYITIVEFRIIAYVCDNAIRFIPCRVYVETIEIYAEYEDEKPVIVDYEVKEIKIEGVSYDIGDNMRQEWIEPSDLSDKVKGAIRRRAIAAVKGTMPGPRIDNEFDSGRDEL
jgi:hypothetical protein